jgi:hypothetical protein
MPLDFPNSPTDGQFYEGFVWDSTEGVWRARPDSPSIPVTFLVVAGGGGGGQGDGTSRGGGGGAGGYRSSVFGENSGGGLSAEPPLMVKAGESYNVTVGDGGAGGNGRPDNNGQSGLSSVFGPIVSTGGAGAPREYATASGHGGSGAGGGAQNLATTRYGSAGISGQGFSGGTMVGSSASAGGGGGAGGVGTQPTAGIGVSSSITGTAVTRAAGGPGNTNTTGTVNTGNGGGGGITGNVAGAGGRGVVILRMPGDSTITVGNGLTSTNSLVSGNRVYVFTEGTGTVTF